MKCIETILRRRKIGELRKWQKEVFENTGVLGGKSLIVNAPTGAGKSLIAEVLIQKYLDEQKGKKCVYLAPLRSLCLEKWREWKEILGWNVGVAVGDFTENYDKLKNRDVIVTTFEKFNNIITSKPEWLEKLGCVVVDEIHSLIEESRSAVLEHILMVVKDKCQILGLSATIKNLDEIAEWLNAEIYKGGMEKPKNLDVYVVCKNRVYDKRLECVRNVKDWRKLVVEKILEGKRVIVFVNRRKSCQSEAMKLMVELENGGFLSECVDIELIELFGDMVRYGVAYHFGLMDSKTRRIVEDAFRDGKIKCLVATRTLAMGVNLPADVVVLKDLFMFSEKGMEWMKAIDVWQMIGRAGRFGQGEAYLVIGSQKNLRRVFEEYVYAEYEKVMSRLVFSKMFPTLVLQSIGLLGGSALEEEIVDYWNDSLFCYQYANGKVMIENRVRWVLEDLKFSDLVEVDKVGVIEQYSLTEIGEVVARFCVDVNTVLKFIDLIDEIDKKRNVIGVIDLLVRSGVVELLSGRKDEIVRLARDILWLCENSYIGGFNGEDEKHVVRIVKTIKLLDEWLSGKDVNVAVLNLEDIERYVSCFGLISKYLGYEDLYGWFRDLQLRVRYGVPANLVDIVRQKGVGRKKALRYLNMKKLTKCV